MCGPRKRGRSHRRLSNPDASGPPTERRHPVKTKKKKLVPLALHLTVEQFRRVDVIAKMIRATPEDLVLGLAIGNVDGFGGDKGAWAECEDHLHHIVKHYGEKKNHTDAGFCRPAVEDTAPARLQRLAGREAIDREDRPSLVRMTEGDLERVCRLLVIPLQSVMPITDEDEDGFGRILAGWRKYSKNFVREGIASAKKLHAEDSQRALTRKEAAEIEKRVKQEFADFNELADTLERLIPQLPIIEEQDL